MKISHFRLLIASPIFFSFLVTCQQSSAIELLGDNMTLQDQVPGETIHFVNNTNTTLSDIHSPYPTYCVNLNPDHFSLSPHQNQDVKMDVNHTQSCADTGISYPHFTFAWSSSDKKSLVNFDFLMAGGYLTYSQTQSINFGGPCAKINDGSGLYYCYALVNLPQYTNPSIVIDVNANSTTVVFSNR